MLKVLKYDNPNLMAEYNQIPDGAKFIYIGQLTEYNGVKVKDKYLMVQKFNDGTIYGGIMTENGITL